ncbi:MAG: DNA-directed RNA polymerase subunit omega [Bacteroidota bacterium]|nr:DNA-directed RNA polymerase subunit omega [Bacteroidota bacterium]MDX5426624.1 DNA-directed RNA polymerase subunit omega [Bacteroidota bacterium]MDX5448567.1 DNA-directed RNA polymerase subunit omega [Bacteroidota bacterium]MDX5504633.1 DNA-directed RNA polymerase subunit omega [Bacteroidota bacterium]
MTDFKKVMAPRTTQTQDQNAVDGQVDNIYEAIAIIGKRAEQINDEMREELHSKLQEFASNQDSLEEIFENKEQIEVSKFYESLPKPTAIALKEWLEGKVYFRDTAKEENNDK